MKERPILFSAPMVLALLAGTKTQTRRALTTQPLDVLPMKGDAKGRGWVGLMSRGPNTGTTFRCKYGQPGDRLWVRETWLVNDASEAEINYRADNATKRFITGAPDEFWRGKSKDRKWRPSIFMPRWASRITLEITEVRVERLQSISEADAKAEGSPRLVTYRTARDAYSDLWEEINGAGSWATNPWVWALTFRRVTP